MFKLQAGICHISKYKVLVTIELHGEGVETLEVQVPPVSAPVHQHLVAAPGRAHRHLTAPGGAVTPGHWARGQRHPRHQHQQQCHHHHRHGLHAVH